MTNVLFVMNMQSPNQCWYVCI